MSPMPDTMLCPPIRMSGKTATNYHVKINIHYGTREPIRFDTDVFFIQNATMFKEIFLKFLSTLEVLTVLKLVRYLKSVSKTF